MRFDLSGSRGWRSVGVGAAGVAVALAVVPVAHADTGGTNPAPSSAPEGVVTPAEDGTSTVTDTSSTPIQADFGYQKYRVGVQIKSGAYVPPGTTTAGTELTYTETGPDVDGPVTNTCVTDPSTVVEGSTASYCLVPETERPTRAQVAANAPTPPGVPSDELFTAGPGDKITVRQTTVEANLLKDTSKQVLARCDANEARCPSA